MAESGLRLQTDEFLSLHQTLESKTLQIAHLLLAVSINMYVITNHVIGIYWSAGREMLVMHNKLALLLWDIYLTTNIIVGIHLFCSQSQTISLIKNAIDWLLLMGYGFHVMLHICTEFLQQCCIVILRIPHQVILSLHPTECRHHNFGSLGRSLIIGHLYFPHKLLIGFGSFA